MERELCVVIGTITPFNHFGLELNFCGQTNPNPFPPFPPSTNNVGLQCGLLGIVLAWANGLACIWVQWGGTTRQNKTTITSACTHMCVCVCVCVCALVRCCVYKVCDEFSKKPTTIGGRCATWHAHQWILYSKRVSSLSLSLSLSLLCTTRNGIYD
jgi:hypothetical protein